MHFGLAPRKHRHHPRGSWDGLRDRARRICELPCRRLVAERAFSMSEKRLTHERVVWPGLIRGCERCQQDLPCLVATEFDQRCSATAEKRRKLRAKLQCLQRPFVETGANREVARNKPVGDKRLQLLQLLWQSQDEVAQLRAAYATALSKYSNGNLQLHDELGLVAHLVLREPNRRPPAHAVALPGNRGVRPRRSPLGGRIRRRLRLLKKSFPARVLETVSRLALATSIEVWFQDEMRVGQKNSLVYQWAKKGTRPRQPKDQRYENAYLFGAVCPSRDTGVAIIMPYANTAAMRKHLEEISRAVAPGAHALVLLDQAGWHTTRKLKVPQNLTMVSLPPACSELNSAENIWQYLRQTYLSNRVFKSYTDILDACQEAWQKLLDETGRIASIATRDWAIIGQSI